MQFCKADSAKPSAPCAHKVVTSSRNTLKEGVLTRLANERKVIVAQTMHIPFLKECSCLT